MFPVSCYQQIVTEDLTVTSAFFGASIFHSEAVATFIVKKPVHEHLDLTPLQHGEPLTAVLVTMVSSHVLLMHQPRTWVNRASCGVLKLHKLRGWVNIAGAEVSL